MVRVDLLLGTMAGRSGWGRVSSRFTICSVMRIEVTFCFCSNASRRESRLPGSSVDIGRTEPPATACTGYISLAPLLAALRRASAACGELMPYRAA